MVPAALPLYAFNLKAYESDDARNKRMNIEITIKEQPGGEVAVRIRQEAGLVTSREDRYATEIGNSIKEHLKTAMPLIVKRVLAAEKN